jgi:hypothetical protein
VGSIPLPAATLGQLGQPLWLKREAGPLVATLMLLGGPVWPRGVPGVGPALSPAPPGLKEQEVTTPPTGVSSEYLPLVGT